MLEIVPEDNAVVLAVKVVPGASRTGWGGLWQGRAKIAVAAPAEKGKANHAVIAFLAKQLGVRKRDVTVVAGLSSPLKKIRIQGATEDAVRAVLGLSRP